MSAFEFLIGIRNARAHGDERKVFPLNSNPDDLDRCNLEGFSFSCSYSRKHKLIWCGKVNLLEQDMRRIGVELAKQFCDSLESKGSNFQTVASRVLEPA